MFAILKRVVHRNDRPTITDDPMFEHDRERMNNMNYIYNINDVEVVQMMRMKRAPFNSLVNTFRVRGCLKITSTVISKSN
jgi:hypothetical protein